MKEVCSCGASKSYKIEGPLSEPRFEKLVELFEDWRKNHLHEIIEEEDSGHIHESSSQTEIAYNDLAAPPTLGFRNNFPTIQSIDPSNQFRPMS